MGRFFTREFLLFLNIPKHVYLPLSIYSIIYVIFIILDLSSELKFTNIFISSFIAVFIISEANFKEDFETGVIEKLIIENENLTMYVFSKLLVQFLFIFIPMLAIGLAFNGLFNGLPENLSLFKYSISYLACLLTLSIFFNLGSIVSIRKGSSLNALITIPFLIPFIILVKGLFVDGQWIPNFYFLMAYFIFSISFINLVIVRVIRIQAK